MASNAILRHSTALIRRDDAPSDAVKDVIDNLFSGRTKVTYKQENVKLILYLYDLDADEYVSDFVLNDFHKAHDTDQENERTKKSRKNLRNCIFDCLEKMNRWNKRCPIILPKLSFNLITDCMVKERSQVENDNFLANSTYGTIKSSLVYLFNISGNKMEHGLCKDLDLFMRSLKKKITRANAKSGKSLEEGKKPMSFPVYELLAKKLFESTATDALFAHTYLVLEWNLMARSQNVDQLGIAHIEWRQDCLICFIAMSKGNQTGEDSE